MKRSLAWQGISVSMAALVTLFAACGADEREPAATPDAGADTTTPFVDAGPDRGGLPTAQPDPKTCAEAAEQKAYMGCDFWPTVTSNVVSDVFDFAVAVANVGLEPVNVTVTGANGVNKTALVNPQSLSTIYLPWVRELKGPEDVGLEYSVLVRNGAYHLVADKPVVVYQFSPLEFRAHGGEPGKDWSKCPPLQGQTECFSYSNDASLLLPSTAMTGNYRVMGDFGYSAHPTDPAGNFLPNQPLQAIIATSFSVTATTDNTHVTVKLGRRGLVVGTGGVQPPTPDAGAPEGGADAGADATADASVDSSAPDASTDASSDASTVDAGFDAGANVDPIPAVAAGGTFDFVLNKGDVAEIVARPGQVFDFSGTLVLADQPVQVLSTMPCQNHPLDTYACDHEEESVFPAETFGKQYVVTAPSAPTMPGIVPHLVRIYGNADGTTLTYQPARPGNCPTSINAGEVADCGEVQIDFVVSGDKAFGVGSFMLGGARVDPTGGSPTEGKHGDPSMSLMVAAEQFRQSYVFLAPIDYKENFVNIVAGPDTQIKIDGQDATANLAAIAGTGFFVARLPLGGGPTKDGSHYLTSTRPVGIQVMGYGDYTSYQYPGGLNLSRIEPPPK